MASSPTFYDTHVRSNYFKNKLNKIFWSLINNIAAHHYSLTPKEQLEKNHRNHTVKYVQMREEAYIKLACNGVLLIGRCENHSTRGWSLSQSSKRIVRSQPWVTIKRQSFRLQRLNRSTNTTTSKYTDAVTNSTRKHISINKVKKPRVKC